MPTESPIATDRANLAIDLVEIAVEHPVDDAIALVVAALRVHLGWPVAHVWLADESDRLMGGACWTSAADAHADAFRNVVTGHVLTAGHGLAGAALLDGVVRFAPRLAGRDPRAHAASSSKLVGGVAIPVGGIDRTWAVIEILSDREQPEDDEFARVASHIARVLGRQFDARRSADSAAFLLQIVDHIAHPIFVKDCRFRFVALNHALCELVGFRREAMIGKEDHDFFPKEQADFFRQKDQELFRTAGPVVIEEEPITTSSGETRWLATTKVPLLDPSGQVTHIVGIIHDITQLKAAQSQIRDRNAELERVNRELEAFSYSVSHDLRTPLRGIDGFTEAVLEDYAEFLPDPGREYLLRVRSASRRMGALIDDLLSLSHVTRASIERRPIDLSALAVDIVGELRTSEPARVVDFAVTEGLMVDADSALTRILLENLLRNAWKFTSKSGDARIEVGHRVPDGFFVRDNGVGFDPAQVGRLFRPFSRLHNNQDYPGSGVGLATVHRIVARHGGTIVAEGSPERGATFRFTLAG